MSVKSVDSLTDKCTDFFEMSISARTLSDNSLEGSARTTVVAASLMEMIKSYLLISGDEGCLAHELMDIMSPAVLSKLRRCFRNTKEKCRDLDIDRKVEEVMRAAAAEEGIEFAVSTPGPRDDRWLNEERFVAASNKIFGHHKYSTHAHALFRLLDPFHMGKVWWGQLVDRLVAVGAKKTRSRADVWVPAVVRDVTKLKHCKRESIVKIVNVEKDDSFCYVVVSKGGRVGIYSGDLKLLHSYEVFYDRCGAQRRIKNRWVTDAIYLNDVQYLMVSASDRSITVYDASTLIHNPVYSITGITNIPTVGDFRLTLPVVLRVDEIKVCVKWSHLWPSVTKLSLTKNMSVHLRVDVTAGQFLNLLIEKCLAYCSSYVTGGSSELVLGTERGDLIRLQFLQPRISLFHTKSPDNINYYFWMELRSPPHSSYCSITTWRRVHSRTVRRVCYVRDGDLILSCSHDSDISVRSRHVSGKLDDYIYRVQRGVTCFHVVPSLHLLATGSADGIVRLWDTSQAAPFASLPTANFAAVLDVTIIAAKEIILGFCNNCNLHIWDLYEECLLQIIKIKFPFLGVLGKTIEFGTCSIYPGPARKLIGTEDESPREVPQDTSSRRGSNVYQGSTGGLMLQPEPLPVYWETKKLEQNSEYLRWARSDVILCCCDHVCGVIVDEQLTLGDVLPAPAATLRTRLPHGWDLPEHDCTLPEALSPVPPPPTLMVLGGHLSPCSKLPEQLEQPVLELEELLRNAGLQGILEKDFVLMQGLKCDLNQKMTELSANMGAMNSCVSMGAPYLAASVHEVTPISPGDEMTDRYRQVMKLFPGPSVAATPTGTGSEVSTPRRSRGSRFKTQD